MKKYRYRFHPPEYAIGETEKFYSDMETKGWRLVKRGQYLSKFTAVPPSRARYRIEVSAPRFLEEPGLPEEQIGVYEDCGWEYVDFYGMIHVFRAPEGSDAPEFYLDPAQQAATLKGLRRSYVWAWVPICLLLGLQFLLAAAMNGGAGSTLSRLGTELRGAWVEGTALMLLCFLLLLWGIYCTVRGAWTISRTYRRMRRGQPLDHSPGGRHLCHKIISRGLAVLIAVSAVLAGAQWLGEETHPLPQEADGPYLLLEDLGLDGERSHLFYDSRTSEVTVSHSLLADYWDVFEVMGENSGAWMYQDVYRLRRPDMAEGFAYVLMDSATFARSAESFTPVDIEGLDGAWVCGDLEAVAVRGNLAAYITYMAPGGEDDRHLLAALEALAGRWAS